MKPVLALERSISILVAADPNFLAPPALANHVHLVIDAFTPSSNTDVASLTLATFTGSTPKNVAVGAQQSFVDPLTQDQVVQLIEPVGGWSWTCSAAPVPLQTVYGYVVTDNTDAVTLGSDLLPTPVPIQSIGDNVTVPNIRLTVPPGVMS